MQMEMERDALLSEREDRIRQEQAHGTPANAQRPGPQPRVNSAAVKQDPDDDDDDDDDTDDDCLSAASAPDDAHAGGAESASNDARTAK